MGAPIPAFRMGNGQVFMTAASVKAIAQLFGEKGSILGLKCLQQSYPL